MTARIGLVLGGGGYTGTAFHAGVLAALAAAGWDARDAEIIVGTSAGSTAAVLLRAGFPPSDYVPRMLGAALSPEGQRVMADIGPITAAPARPHWAPRPASPSLARRVLRSPGRFPVGVLAAALLPAGGVPIEAVNPGYGPLFDRWPDRPTWITAVSLDSGDLVAFGRDRHTGIPAAVSASCAIPGYFEPVLIDGERFVDGGAHSTHNAHLLLGQGLDAVIVSAPLSTTDIWPPDLHNIWRLPFHRSLAAEVRRLRDDGLDVAVIAPDAALRQVMGNNTMALHRRPAVALATQRHVADALWTNTALRRIVARASRGGTDESGSH